MQSKVVRHEKLESRLHQDLQSTQNRLTELENECSTLRQTCSRLEREQKQRESSAKSDSVRLHRQEELVTKLKAEGQSLKATCKVFIISISFYIYNIQSICVSLSEIFCVIFDTLQELKGELANLKDTNKKSLNVKDKQIEQLVDGFQKQMQLIDVLRRQKVNKEKDISVYFC